MARKAKLNMDTTDTNSVYKRARKYVIAKIKGLCPLCPYHGGENAGRDKIKKSWKKMRKTKYKKVVQI